MLKAGSQNISAQNAVSVRIVYDKYAGMLFGYLLGVLRDPQLAEEHLVNIFTALANEPGEIKCPESYNWCRLLRFAKSKLSFLIKTTPGILPGALFNDKLPDAMTNEQKHIFCGIYYHGKTIAALSKQLDKPEVSIRKILIEAVAIIKNA